MSAAYLALETPPCTARLETTPGGTRGSVIAVTTYNVATRLLVPNQTEGMVRHGIFGQELKSAKQKMEALWYRC